MYKVNDDNLLKLKKKIKENPQSFIFILGSGMSVPAGLPSWEGLLSEMTDLYENFCRDEEDCKKNVKFLRNTKEYWQAFAHLKRLLPEVEYEKCIATQLSDKDRIIPKAYELIWQLDINGVITFNIDKLILNAFSKVKQSSVDFATGKETVKYSHFLSGEEKFVFFPHGYILDPSTWVFTEKEKKEIYADSNFKKIMTAFLNTKNIVIMGFNPQEHNFTTLLNDISITGKIAGYNNYYIGPDLSNYDNINLGNYGISCISYTPSDFTHPEIVSILQEFCSYIPYDIEFPSVYAGKKYSEEDIPAYESCMSMGNNQLREILNGNIANIIPPNKVPSKEQMQKLQFFYQKYSAQMHIAWFVNPQSEFGNKIYEYEIKSAVGRGAFGNVFEAYDERGNKYALKILLPEVKDKVEYLSCFRRGIRSMNILKERNIDGMVKIYSSYEVPACIVMDYVEGITLRDAIDNCKLISPNKKIEVVIKIATIINNAHNLDECILHRDLKPENIMLQDFYYENTEDPISIVILDFDLSWHKGATELTVALGAMSQGFMAPEQVEEDEKYKRNTAVDMYSIGMLAYYILIGKNPAPYQHQFYNFKEEMIEHIREKYSVSWKCLPNFLAETIEKATLNDPGQRISLDGFIYNMNAALNMVISNEIMNSNPLLLRELAAQIDNCDEIQIGDFGRKLSWSQDATGKSILLELTQRGKDVIIKVKLTKMRMGQDLRDPKYLDRAKDKALSMVDSTIFYRKNGEILLSEINIEIMAKLTKNLSMKHISKIAKNIQEIRIEMELK